MRKSLDKNSDNDNTSLCLIRASFNSISSCHRCKINLRAIREFANFREIYRAETARSCAIKDLACDSIRFAKNAFFSTAVGLLASRRFFQ